VFVYGTLLRGERNHHHLAGARFMTADSTVGPMRMLDLGRSPAVIDEPVAPVTGEVWEVDAATLAELDVLEDVPHRYQRRRVELCSGLHAWMYVFSSLPGGEGWTDVPEGDYRSWVRARGSAP